MAAGEKAYVLTGAQVERLDRLLKAFESGKLDELLGGPGAPRPRNTPASPPTVILSGFAGLAADEDQTPVIVLDSPWNGVTKIAYNYLDEPPTGARIVVGWHGSEPPIFNPDLQNNEFAPAAQWRLMHAVTGPLTGTLAYKLAEGQTVFIAVDKVSSSVGVPAVVQAYEVLGCAEVGEKVMFDWNPGMLRWEVYGAKCPCSGSGGGGGPCAGQKCSWIAVAEGGLHWTILQDCPGSPPACTCLDPTIFGAGPPTYAGQFIRMPCVE